MAAGAVVALEAADQHEGAVAGEHDLGQRAGKAAAWLDQRHQRAGGDVDALQHALPVVQDLAGEPVALVGLQERVVGQHLGRLALRLEDQDADVGLVETQVQDGIVELARQPQRPEWAPSCCMASAEAGGAAVGPWMVMVARRVARSISTRMLE